MDEEKEKGEGMDGEEEEEMLACERVKWTS